VSLSLLLSSTAFTILSFLWPMNMLHLRIIHFDLPVSSTSYHPLTHSHTLSLSLSLSLSLIMHMHTHSMAASNLSTSWPFVCVRLHGLNTHAYTQSLLLARGHPWTLFIHCFWEWAPRKIDGEQIISDWAMILACTIRYDCVCTYTPKERKGKGNRSTKSDRHAGC
jgi:hypothetical protein